MRVDRTLTLSALALALTLAALTATQGQAAHLFDLRIETNS
jgi:hypothetical protein